MGCAFVAKNDFPAVGGMVLTTIVATTVIYELTGAFVTKYALQKAGEAFIEHHQNI